MRALIEQLKQSGQDYEFYPTTNEIIDRMLADLKHLWSEFQTNRNQEDPVLHTLNASREHKWARNTDCFSSVLDIGAGNGKVLKAFRDLRLPSRYERDGMFAPFNSFHAIEKSQLLCQQLDNDILIVGTDFNQQNLFNKVVDVTFCNPPYKEYESWMEKIIRQSSSRFVYMVVPQRWEASDAIADAVAWRDVDVEKLGEFDFEDAEDRQARAKVHCCASRYQQMKMRSAGSFSPSFPYCLKSSATRNKWRTAGRTTRSRRESLRT